MKHPHTLIILCLLALLLTCLAPLSTAQAQQQSPSAPRPTTLTPPDSCATAQCHAPVKNHKVLHGPLNVNSCDACHQLSNPQKHQFKFTRDKDQLCTFCHQLDFADSKVIHKPLTTGQCLSCHNPHGGTQHSLIRGKTTNDLCQNCHQDVTANQKHVHGPVAAGACSACHQSHASKYPKLLVAQGQDLCLNCHQELAQQLQSVSSKHKPVLTGDCLTCHNPHASNQPRIIKAEPGQLCTTACHQNIGSLASNAKTKHSVVLQDQACLNCHTAHGSDLNPLLKSKPISLCMSCHNQPIQTPDNRKLPDLNEVTNPNLHLHGPLTDGFCAKGCHNPHGSDNSKLLAKPYPPGFYESFKLEKYDLCFSCHDKQLVLTPSTQGLTSFRNGETNLHFLHVNKSQRGRSCRACHAVHAGPNQKHIRNAVPYGNWELPIRYQPTPTGGSCAPGCHQPLTYDRNQPINYAIPPASQPSSSEK